MKTHLISVGSVLLLLLVIEAVGRLAFHDSIVGRWEYGFDTTSGIEVANGRILIKRSAGKRFRDDNLDARKPDQGLRIAALSDSVVKAASLESSYVKQMVPLLEAQGIPAQGLNLGVAGFGSRRAYYILQQVAELDPDIVFLHIHDLNEYTDEREWQRKNEFASWHIKNLPMKSCVIRRIYEAKTEKVAWKLLTPEMRLQSANVDADAELAARLSPELRAAWRSQVLEYGEKAAALAAARGFSLVLVSQQCVDHPKDKLVAFAPENYDSIVDQIIMKYPAVIRVSMKELFEGTDLAKMYSDRVHPSKEGHLLMARSFAAIAVRLKNQREARKSPR